ncbi:channel accessory protein ArfC, sunset domain variant [Mycobacterium kansasii]|uniref:Membrane protein n=4 Tax=Mycobacterium kansasii TaxID=1768 RepID=U5WQX4_MYCKA|nr:membrane protein [Mycobacterium kansasii]AGZ50465.1 membrane protein [Mycobacterium kansasii ATCC 12478]EUA17899.1 putative conserved exported/membrane protein [Mycobacterium kansasii 662]KEP39524.1 membrane protein [Mycobacterium kansasii]UCA21038.1 hypothetical protein LA359_06795 [Mycobacterium kansasii]UGT81089.1 hypothetical protein LTS70_27170 [Mycobacterium kansasii]
MTGHVHWWLVGLAFALGMLLTFTLMVGPVKEQLPQHKSGTMPRRPAKKATAAETPRKRAVAHKRAPAKKIPAAKKVPETPDADTASTQEIAPAKVTPAQQVPDATESSAEQTVVIGESSLQSPARFAPYGPGSARAGADGSGPEGWLVKGRTDTRLYYTPDDPDYDATVAQVWFQDEGAAARAFFTPWRKSARRE